MKTSQKTERELREEYVRNEPFMLLLDKDIQDDFINEKCDLRLYEGVWIVSYPEGLKPCR